MAIVLTSNDANVSDRYQWKDITGVHYHYPNIYRNLIQTGESFIYYRGVRRAAGPRQAAEYFGCGCIGSIWPDPETEDAPPIKKAWYCAIEDFLPFVPAVPAKLNGVFLEEIPQNMWRSGVRPLPAPIYDKIIQFSGIKPPRSEGHLILPALPPIEAVNIPTIATSVLLQKRPRKNTGSTLISSGRARRSRHAKLVGDRAEQIAVKWIEQNIPGATGVRWVAQAGETPGWDIEFSDADGNLVAVEVKGSSGFAISDFEVTANEFEAMRHPDRRYLILLVANCLSVNPAIEVISDLAGDLDRGDFISYPAMWRITRRFQG